MKRIIRPCIAVGLLALLVSRMNGQEVLSTAAQLPLWALGGILAVMIVELVVSTLRWSVALRMHRLQFDRMYLFRTVANGYFFNNFLPTAIGGDAYRVYKTLPADGYRSRAVSAVLLDRAGGFGALLALGAVAAVYLRPQQEIARAYLWLFAIGALGAVFAIYAVQRGWLKRLPERLRRTATFDALKHNWQHLLDARADWIPLAGWSFAMQSISILIVYWLFLTAGHPQPLAWCALMTAASGVAALLPLSINGIGLMEGSLVAMAVALGADYDAAALVAIVRRLLMFALSLLCGLNYLIELRPVRVPWSARRQP